jgi:hypothetical protein
VFTGNSAILAFLFRGEWFDGENPRVDGTGATVAIVGGVVSASVGGRGCETSLFATAGSLEFVVAAHLEDLWFKDIWV